MFRFRNTDKNTVSEHKPNPKKTGRILVAALLAVIFILGLGAFLFNLGKKPVKQSESVASVPSEIPGWWMQKYFGSSVCEKDTCKPESDPEKDGLTNAQEFYYHTDPLNAFTVQDQLNDGQLVAAGFDPSRAGHMTFEQATAPDNILGESLLLDQDIKNLVAESKDISRVPLPLLTDDQLKISYAETSDGYEVYVTNMQKIIDKYFSAADLNNIGAILQSGNGPQAEQIITKSNLLSAEIKAITVPQKMLNYHKYIIAFFQLLPDVLSIKISAMDLSSPQSDLWFEKAQALFAVSQKLNYEQQIMSQQVTAQP